MWSSFCIVSFYSSVYMCIYISFKICVSFWVLFEFFGYFYRFFFIGLLNKWDFMLLCSLNSNLASMLSKPPSISAFCFLLRAISRYNFRHLLCHFLTFKVLQLKRKRKEKDQVHFCNLCIQFLESSLSKRKSLMHIYIHRVNVSFIEIDILTSCLSSFVCSKLIYFWYFMVIFKRILSLTDIG